MFDFDPRDSDSRDDERFGSDRHRTGRGSSDDHDREDDGSQPKTRSRDRDEDARELGRGPGSDSRSSHSDEHARDRLDSARWPTRDRDPRERTLDPREVLLASSGFRADWSVRSFAIATGTTRCGGGNPARLPPSARFESSRAGTFVTLAIVRPNHAQATFGISARRG